MMHVFFIKILLELKLGISDGSGLTTALKSVQKTNQGS